MAGRMFHAKLLAITLVIVSGSAWAQGEEEFTAGAGKEIDAYALCLKQHAFDGAKTSDSENDVVKKALSSCGKEQSALLARLQEPPLSLSEMDAFSSLREMQQALRPKMLETIKQARGA